MLATPDKKFSKRFNAQRAAKAKLKLLGHPNPDDAKDGVDFQTWGEGANWSFKILWGSHPTPKNFKAAHGAAVAALKNTAKVQIGPTADKTPTPPVKGKRAERAASAAAGVLPTPPDFTAKTHERFRNKLADLIKLVEAGDVKALKAYPIKPVSSSPKALDRYRNLAVIALEAKPKKPGEPPTLAEHEIDVIKNATSFSATKFKGRGKYDTHETPHLANAREKARGMGEGAMVYAINAQGRKVLVGGIYKEGWKLTDNAQAALQA